MRPTSLIIAAACLACSGSTEPGEVLPRLTTYDYVFETPVAAGGPFAVRCEGTFTVTFASLDSIAGTWNVPACRYRSNDPAPGYQPAALFGAWNVDAYSIWSRPTTGGQYIHRFSRRNGVLSCQEGRNTYGTSGGGIASVVATTCTLAPR